VIGLTLRGGIMENGVVSPTDEGTVQGSPLSPLLSNVVLDELDKELERRGLEFCRFADDCNIFVATKAAANRAMENVTRFIEGKLKLQVNREKSQVAPTEKVKFLGLTFVAGQIAIAAKSLKRAMDKAKELIPRRTHQSLEETITKINLWYVGWSNYFKMTQYPSQLKSIETHIRRRLRAQIVSNKKQKRQLVKDLLAKGVSPKLVYGCVYKNREVWALSHTKAVEKAYSNRWFEDKGLKTASDKKLSHWFDVKIWIRVT
jgi:hypothetical protein